jgi:flagellar assembly protein FliH
MQLSYRIIKNGQIAYGEKGVSVADINTSKFIEAGVEEEIKPAVEENPEEAIDVEKIKEEIRQQLYLENEKAKKDLMEKTLKKLNEEAEVVKKEAAQQGYKKGLEEGFEKGLTECQDECLRMKDAALDMLRQAEEEVKSYFKDNKEKIIQLAGDIAESIVNTTIDLSSENILLLIKPVLQQYERNENIVISCNPANAELLKTKLSELEELSQAARLTILEDGNLDKNTCIIENENQIIDLDIRKQINSIVMEMKDLEV